jgi:hypothetical protein
VRISTATFHAWKAKYGVLDVAEARWLKALEDENMKLKRMASARSRAPDSGKQLTTVLENGMAVT